MNPTATLENWSLEVVRGQAVGKRIGLGNGSLILGNALNGSPGIDLSEQEGAAPRRMAARQSQLDIENGSVQIRDLDSPGGTFVNRQRVLSGQSRNLVDGDVIQLGGVQLRLVKSSSATASQPPIQASPATPMAFAFGSGAVCKSWDDFLVISAQKWTELRDELTSGRLAAYLSQIGRGDMAPDPKAAGNADERLDAWIGRLPATRRSSPELEVHPQSLSVSLAPGASTRRKFQVSNTGFRLLKTSIKSDASAASWLKVVAEAAGEKTITTIDCSDVTIELSAPEPFLKPLVSKISFTGNGGDIAVSVTLQPASKLEASEPVAAPSAAPQSLGFRSWIARQPAAYRFATCAVFAVVIRLMIAAFEWIPHALGMHRSADADLLGPALAFALIGSVFGLILAIRRGHARDSISSAFAGGILGVLISAIAFASCRAVDSVLSPLVPGSSLLRLTATAILGAIAAALSVVLVPPAAAKESGK